MYERPFPPQQPSPQGPPPPQPYQPHPYQGAPQPYQGAQQPYQGAPQPYQGARQPYRGASQPHQGAQQPYQGAPHPYAPPAAATRIPDEARPLRRWGAVLLDGLLALTAACSALKSAEHAGLPALQTCYAAAGAGFGLSFLNQVLLTRIAGASLGKFAVRTRVIRETDASRPRLPRLFRRWLGGYLFIVVWIIAACFEMDDDPEDFCGLRLVRYKDLRALVPAYGH
ncbi:RDD family protein [Streptomyces platensis]|uniref:RDD family protein n=1 Tax=Streptomyces platensis TaxID=58346 RepID=UPI003C2BE1E0